MGSSVVRCPRCRALVRLPEEAAGAAFRCGKCKQVLRVPAGVQQAAEMAGAAADHAGEPPASRARVSEAGERSLAGFDAPGEGRKEPRTPADYKAKPAGNILERRLQQAEERRRGDVPQGPFFKRFPAVLGILAVPLLILFLVGFAYEPAAIAAVIAGIAAMIVMLLIARVWLWIVVFREDRIDGLLCLLVPFYEILYIVKRLGPTLRPMAVFGSALLVSAATVAMLLAYEPFYGTRSHAKQTAQRAEAIAATIVAREKLLQPPAAEAEVLEVRARVIGFPKVDGRLVAQTDAALRRFQRYEPGSFSSSDNGARISFRHRGDSALQHQYLLFIRMESGINMMLIE